VSTRTNNEMAEHFSYLLLDSGEWSVERGVEGQLIQLIALKDPGNGSNAA
jgi:hypothetical protein